MNTLKFLIDELEAENYKIKNRRQDLNYQSDFSNDGEKLHKNQLKIEKLKKLPVRIVVGFCSCKKPIPRPQYEINFCALCHKEITNTKQAKIF